MTLCLIISKIYLQADNYTHGCYQGERLAGRSIVYFSKPCIYIYSFSRGKTNYGGPDIESSYSIGSALQNGILDILMV